MNSYDVGDAVTVRAVFGGNVTELVSQMLAGATTLTVLDATGYTGTDTLIMEPGTAREERLTVSSVSGTTITVTAASVYAHGVATAVWELADPTAITLKVKDPNNHITTYTYALSEVTKDGTGRYSKSITIDQSGPWWYRWAGTGAVVAASEMQLAVRRSEF